MIRHILFLVSRQWRNRLLVNRIMEAQPVIWVPTRAEVIEMRSATKNGTGKDPAYLKFIRSLPCCVCAGLLLRDGGRQRSITEAAHTGMHGLSQKSPDRTAIPLCRLHHREGATSLHELGKKFWGHHDLDRVAVIAEFNAAYEIERKAA